MTILSKDRISLQATATDKTDAIRKAGELLVKSGCVLPEYVDGMLKREESMSTSLGNGVAIPHGVYENREHILQTGSNLADVIDNEDTLTELLKTNDPDIVLKYLGEKETS